MVSSKFSPRRKTRTAKGRPLLEKALPWPGARLDQRPTRTRGIPRISRRSTSLDDGQIRHQNLSLHPVGAILTGFGKSYLEQYLFVNTEGGTI